MESEIKLKKKIIGIIVSILILTTFSSVVGTENFESIIDESNTDSSTTSRDVDNWSMLGHDAARTGFSTGTGPETNETLFIQSFQGGVLGGISVAEAKVYISTFGNKHLYCLHAYTGEIIFDHLNPAQISSVPVIDGDRIYFGSYDKKLYCLDATSGDVLWTYPTNGVIYSSPALYNDKLYFGTFSQKMICVDTDGNEIWTYIAGGYCNTPAVVDDKVYFGSNDDKVYCLDAEGNGDGTTTKIWDYPTGGDVKGALYVDDGKVYAGSLDNNLYCLNAIDGFFIWSKPMAGPFNSPGGSVHDGRVYVGSYLDKKLYCLNGATGVEIWNYSTAPAEIDCIPVNANGKVYFGDKGGNIYCLNESDGLQIWSYYAGNFPFQGASAIYDGIFYAVGNSFNNKLIAFGTVDNEPPETPNPPSGETDGIIGFEYTYTTNVVTDPDGNDVEYLFDWSDGTDSGWMDTPSASHIWTELGSFDVSVKARDVPYWDESNWSENLTVVITNDPPLTPDVTEGPSEGEPDVDYIFTANTTDPNGHQIFYLFDWGDDSNSGWIGPFDSGEPGNASHSWDEAGIYEVTVKAKDEWDAESDFSELLEINITNTPKINIDISGGLGVQATIENLGDVDLDDLSWNISIDGGIILIVEGTSGTIDNIPVGESADIQTERLFGIGFLTITIFVDDVEKTATGFLLGPFVLGVT